MKKVIYAKTLNPEYFDYRAYEYDIKENPDIILSENRDNPGVNDKLFQDITKMAEGYNCYEYEFYYHNSIKEYLMDMMPKKENGKKLSPREIAKIKKVLEGYEYSKTYNCWIEEVMLVCLEIIKGKKYVRRELHGYCQGDWIECWYPVDTDSSLIDYVEAWYFGTGTEVYIYDGEKETIDSPDEMDEGFTFYTASWKIEDIKKEVIDHYGLVLREGDEIEVILWEFKGYSTIKIDNYQLAS